MRCSTSMRRGTLVVTVTLLLGVLGLLAVLVNQLRISTTPPPSAWPPLLLNPCTLTTVHIDQQLFSDDDVPTVAGVLAAAWRSQGWSTQLDVKEDGSTALLIGQRSGAQLTAFLEQYSHAVHLVANGKQQCVACAPGQVTEAVCAAPSGPPPQTAGHTAVPREAYALRSLPVGLHAVRAGGRTVFARK